MESSEQICVYNGMEWLEGGLALCSFQGSREPLGLRPSHDELMRITNILLEPHICNTLCIFGHGFSLLTLVTSRKCYYGQTDGPFRYLMKIEDGFFGRKKVKYTYSLLLKE